MIRLLSVVGKKINIMTIDMYTLNVSHWSNCRYGEYIYINMLLNFTKNALNFKTGLHKYVIYQHLILIDVKLNPPNSFYGYYSWFN